MLTASVLAIVPLLVAAPPYPVPCPDPPGQAAERVTFQAVDGVTVHAAVYKLLAETDDPTTPVLLLGHDDQGSRGETRPIVPRLRRMGYRCVCVDLRVGGSVNRIKNLTQRGFRRNTEAVRNMVAAENDLLAAGAFVREHYPEAPVLVVGCSYSAALGLRVAASHPELFDGVAAFSPAEVFDIDGMPKTWIQDSIRELEAPVFVTSARAEEPDWRPIFDAIGGEAKTWFLPEGRGRHGLRALYEDTPEVEAYWSAFGTFLEAHFPAVPVPGGDGSSGDEALDDGDPER